jgi:hypothetical protein
MKLTRLKLLSLGLIVGVSLNISACAKKNVTEEETTKSVVDVLQGEMSEIDETTEGESSVLETSVEEVKEKETLLGGIEVSDDEEEQIDLIIKQLEEDVEQERVDTEHIDGLVEKETETREQDVIAQENADWENSVRESLGVETSSASNESDDEKGTTSNNTESKAETEYDSDNNPNTREIEGFEEETEPIVGDDGAIVETTERKIQKAKLDGSGPVIGENTSEEMKIGAVYNYFSDDGSKLGHVGDFVMCGKLAINVAPGISEVGYDISSSGDTVTISLDYGDILIKKLNTDDLNVAKMNVSQMSRLSGLSDLSSVYLNATQGSYGAYSQLMIDSIAKNGVQYYSCTFGVYEIKYLAHRSELVYYLINAAKPESSLNELATVQ